MRAQPASLSRRLIPTLGFTLLAAPAFAGAWLQPEGKGQLIINNYYYTADKLFTNTGHQQSQSTYTKYELNPYAEFGWNDWLTVGGSLSLQRTSQSNTTNFGIGDSEFFARLRVWQTDNLILSVSPLIKLPSLDRSSDRPKIGSDDPDAGIGAALGYGFNAWGQHHFAEGAATYRYRFGSPENQWNLSATLGIGLTERWMLMPQIFATYRTKDPQTAVFTQSSGDDYDQLKLQLSAIYKLNDKTSLQLGGFSDIKGKNTGSGQGALISVWRTF